MVAALAAALDCQPGREQSLYEPLPLGTSSSAMSPSQYTAAHPTPSIQHAVGEKVITHDEKETTDFDDHTVHVEDELEEGRVAMLLSAAGKNQVARIRHWIRSGVNPSATDYDYRSALHIAASDGHVEAINALLEEGANVQAKDRFGSSPLDEAVNNGHKQCADILRAAGASHAAVERLEARLIAAAASNNLDDVRLLLESGVSPNCCDYDRRGPLHLAVSEGNIDVAKLLLAFGAKANAEDRFGITPVAEAQRHGTRTGSNPLKALFESSHLVSHAPFLSKFVLFFGGLEVTIIILIGLFVRYGNGAEGNASPTDVDTRLSFASVYPLYQDIHVMIFIGFGFLMTFLRKSSYTGVGLTFLIGALTIQWYLLNRTFWIGSLTGTYNKLLLDIPTLASADFCAGAVLISFGAVLGKVSPVQALGMAVIEVVLYALNEQLGILYFRVDDIGGTITLHMFGAFYGLAFSRLVTPAGSSGNHHNSAVYHSDTFAMIGTVFLWLFWPSFNAALSEGQPMQRAVINTLLSMTGSCVVAFITSYSLRRERSFNMVDVQNATLAGGVAIAACCDQLIEPGSAVAIGAIAGLVSVLGYVYLQGWLENTIGLHDTCGVLNLHGMPSLIGGFASMIAALKADVSSLGQAQLDFIFPARDSRSPSKQAAFQFAFMCCTLGISLVSGTVAGLILRLSFFEPVPRARLFEDSNHWETPAQEIPYYFDERGEVSRGKANTAASEEEQERLLTKVNSSQATLEQQVLAMQRQLALLATKKNAATTMAGVPASQQSHTQQYGNTVHGVEQQQVQVAVIANVFDKVLNRLDQLEKRGNS